MSAREDAIEAGARLLVPNYRARCFRWGAECRTHDNPTLYGQPSGFANQSSAECDALRWARRTSAAVVDAVEPITEAEVRERIAREIEAQAMKWGYDADHWDHAAQICADIALGR